MLLTWSVRGIAPAGFPASDPVANLKRKSTLTVVLYPYQRLTCNQFLMKGQQPKRAFGHRMYWHNPGSSCKPIGNSRLGLRAGLAIPSEPLPSPATQSPFLCMLVTVSLRLSS